MVGSGYFFDFWLDPTSLKFLLFSADIPEISTVEEGQHDKVEQLTKDGLSVLRPKGGSGYSGLRKDPQAAQLQAYMATGQLLGGGGGVWKKSSTPFFIHNFFQKIQCQTLIFFWEAEI
jgi:hypothetical protein